MPTQSSHMSHPSDRSTPSTGSTGRILIKMLKKFCHCSPRLSPFSAAPALISRRPIWTRLCSSCRSDFPIGPCLSIHHSSLVTRHSLSPRLVAATGCAGSSPSNFTHHPSALSLTRPPQITGYSLDNIRLQHPLSPFSHRTSNFSMQPKAFLQKKLHVSKYWHNTAKTGTKRYTFGTLSVTFGPIPYRIRPESSI